MLSWLQADMQPFGGVLSGEFLPCRSKDLAARAEPLIDVVGVDRTALIGFPLVRERPAAPAPLPLPEVMPDGFVAVGFLPGQKLAVPLVQVVGDRYLEL